MFVCPPNLFIIYISDLPDPCTQFLDICLLMTQNYYLAKISAVYSGKLVTHPNFAVLTKHTDAADVDFN